MGINKFIFLSCFGLLFSCGGGLTSEQRSKLKEEMESREIVRVSEDEIMSKALEEGRRFYPLLMTAENPDSLAGAYNFSYSILTDTSNIENELEAKVFNAYDYAAQNGVMMEDNIQRDGDELLYTIPYVRNEMYGGVLFIRFQKKQIVQSLSD